MSQKVNKSDMEKLPYIIAIDFDGTLVHDKYPHIGAIKPQVFKRAQEAKAAGAKLVLWTCRDNKLQLLDEAVNFCKLNGLEFDAVNRNIDEVILMFDNDTRKVFANEYWDDKVPFENWMLCNG